MEEKRERRERNDVVTYELLYASPIQTGDKVEFNTVDFVESRQSRPGPVHTGNKVDRDKLNSRCCRFVAECRKNVFVFLFFYFDFILVFYS